MKKPFALALALTLGGLMTHAAATDIRIYPSFTEVREQVSSAGKTLTVALPQEAWNGVIGGSLDLEGLAFDSAVQKLEANWLSGLEGKTVYLEREGGKTEPVTLVRAKDLLVKDASSKYFTVSYDKLQFDVLPPANPLSPSQTLTYSLKNAGSGTLSYLTRSVSWQPRYTLKASDAGAQLSALADIRNSTDQPYDVKNTELYAGDVNVQGDMMPPAPMLMRAEAATTQAGYAAPKIQSGGELRGLYKYTLSTAFTLPANSVVTLPFLTPKLTKFERYAGLNTYFGTDKREGTLSRFYRFTADDRLPAGPVTVREDGRIVGQTNISETRKGGEVEFTLGDDPDVAYTRTVQTVSQVKDAKGNPTRTTYKVTYTFESSKSRAVRAEVTERVGGRRVTIDSAAPVQNQGTAELRVDVPANGKVSKTFTVVVDNG
ncbi:DUF4139 domain-containing protein [Deinococcus wulumuqiensis]|uniref:DUF4139 domain-containing protein n=1 Tax=Deinococcus wulumuqiensis TaxID=980427 RepID=A0A345IGN6_9DEIO|nr:DUF4139 domain-containing protein [Deinococcus wulumuqiensis]AXG98858.1 DUF4139 domain-containing protein [Deinococcus wulumuqiensis]